MFVVNETLCALTVRIEVLGGMVIGGHVLDVSFVPR